MKSINLFSILLTIMAIFFLSACNGGQDSEGDAADDATEETNAGNTSSPGNYNLSPMGASEAYPNATLEGGYKDGKFMFNVGNYELGIQTPDAEQKMCANSDKGQHIHLIVDDQPYVAKYVPTFDHEVADGEHYVLAFLSRSYHESIKTDAAHMAMKANFSGNSLTSSEEITQPMLFYSRPKGNYVGKSETEKVMLDFYLLNTNLSADGNKVKVNVNSEKEFVIDNWQPYFLEGLPMGDNKIELTLIDKDGNPVNAPLNPVTRVFTLADDPAPGE